VKLVETKKEKDMKNTNNDKMEVLQSEAEILALIDSDALEMPSWDDGCYVR